MKPLEKCCNGCDKPPKRPSLVLCEDCLKKLDKKMNTLLAGKIERDTEE